MKITEIYHVAGKEFSDKQKAFEYENKLRDNLELRARNLKLYCWDMLGYPGEITAIQLINHFCRYHKFDFGKYRNRYVGEIMMIDPQYIKWCIENVSSFRLNKEEEALLNTSWKYSVSGYRWDITHNETSIVPSEKPDYNIIDWEREIMRQDNIKNPEI